MMSGTIILMWSLAGFLNFVFAALGAGLTLTPKYNKGKMTAVWIFALLADFGLVYLFYHMNVNNDLFTALGQCVVLCLILCMIYSNPVENKVFVSLTMSLAVSVATFMFCGTTDTFLGAKLQLFDPVFGPYTKNNILLFMGLKVLVLSIFLILYAVLMRKRFIALLDNSEGQMKNYLIAPVFSVIGFYVINMITNNTDVGIFPTSPFFLPMYLTVCVIFIVEYILIISSVRWTVEAKMAEKEKERIGAE
ncbi:MAG: hypothetical protein II699_03615, partial [Lachnospiraceae bacterium]|nr:hypothetical protein [Lachnospiraceae bacterium]